MPNFHPLNALDKLRDRLRRELSVEQAVHAIEWGNPRAMTEALKHIKRDWSGSANEKPALDQLQTALQRFSSSRHVTSFTDLKYLCYGVTVPVGPNRWRLIDQQPLFKVMLDLVNEREQQSKQFRRCYQGLLSGYFGFDRHIDKPGIIDGGLDALRDFLSKKLDPVLHSSSQRGQVPDWLITLNLHRNLLSTDPCSRYAAALVRDDSSELQQVCAGLGISSNSWVWDEALMAYVRLVCGEQDKLFLQRMGAVLNLVNGRSSLRLPPALAIEATAKLVVRYAHCTEIPEHADLRDTCVEWIGNPWLKRTAWDAVVKHEPARLMVNSWLKKRLIRDFFELLAADGAADLRRLNYWLQWETQISEMWFVLGTDAQANRTPEFQEVRKRMAGQDRRLIDSNSANNAFVMRIGPLLVIEFGVTGNACYVFAAVDFFTNLNAQSLRLDRLKQRNHATRLSHMSHWEPRFDYELKKLLQSVPQIKGRLRDSHEATQFASPPVNSTWPTAQPVVSVPAKSQGHLSPSKRPLTAKPNTDTNPAPKAPWPTTHSISRVPSQNIESPDEAARHTDRRGLELSKLEAPVSSKKQRLGNMEFEQLRRILSKHSVEWEDNRHKGGALWVLIPNKNEKPIVTSVLNLYRFRFAEGKGYWLKDED